VKQTPLRPKRRAKTHAAIEKEIAGGKKPTLGQLHKLCHPVWSKLVKLHANGQCEWCGNPAVHAHHMIAKAQGNTLKYKLENGVALCYLCHVTFHQKNSLTGWKLFERQRPMSFAYVDEHQNDTTKLSRDELADVLADLKKQLKEFA
jgi:5-methylcytosine-specific restriction endonuclease McrA